jgi:16S rRNA G966 N2-methylase RsmD
MTTRPMADKIKGAVFSMLGNLLNQLDREWGQVLDLYSGSGSIGIEALSRGADWADFVEINAGVCRVIAGNLEHTKLQDKARVNNRAVAAFLNNPPGAPGSSNAKRATGGLHRRKGGSRRDPSLDFAPAPAEVTAPTGSEVDNVATQDGWQYDIIFLDPPYADPKIADTMAHVARSGLLKKGGLVVIGHSPRVELAETFGEEAVDGPAVQINRLRYRRHGDSAFSIYLAGDPVAYGFGAQSDANTDVEPDEAESEGTEDE